MERLNKEKNDEIKNDLISAVQDSIIWKAKIINYDYLEELFGLVLNNHFCSGEPTKKECDCSKKETHQKYKSLELCECGGYLRHCVEHNTFPYGWNVSYDICVKCDRTYNTKTS